MKVLPILDITPARLTSTSAVDAPAYVAGTNYALSALVTDNGREYLSLQAANVGHTPATSPTWWQDLGVRNIMKMFNAGSNSATSAASPLNVTLTPGLRINALAMFGVTADSVTATLTVPGLGVVWTQTVTMLQRNTRSWSEYFFGAFTYRESVVFLDLPQYVNAILSVSMTRASGLVQCQTFAIGTATEIGFAQNGAQHDILDFSRVDRDAFGNLTLVPRKAVPMASIPVKIDKASVNKVRQLRKSLVGVAAVYIGINDTADGFFDGLAFVAICRRAPIVIEYWNGALVNYELEGL